MTEERRIFTVTTLKHIQSNQTRCVGYFFEFEDAEEAVVNNDMDINECRYYPYCIIEEVGQGFYFLPINETWYKWDRELNKYSKITEKPKRYNQICCFGIG